MLDRLQDYFYSELGRITELGRLLARLGTFLLFAGVIAQLTTRTINLLATLAKQPEASKTLADIYPGMPVWWVPETWMGTAAAALMVVAGCHLVWHGKMVDRLLKA